MRPEQSKVAREPSARTLGHLNVVEIILKNGKIVTKQSKTTSAWSNASRIQCRCLADDETGVRASVTNAGALTV